jgi:hypothetical protein
VTEQHRLGILLVASMVLCVAMPTNARPLSDTQRILQPMPEGFNRPTLSVFPVVDMGNLKGRKPESTKAKHIWVELVRALRRYKNLRIRAPRRTVKKLQQRVRNHPAYEAARQRAAHGLRLFGNVKLEAANRTLGLAVQELVALRYDMVDPRYVAKLIITRGQALLESKKSNDAKLAFTQALAMYPSARLDPELDHPNAVSVFESTRLGMIRQADMQTISRVSLSVGNPRPQDFYRWIGHGLYGRIENGQLKVTLDLPRGLQLERQSLEGSVKNNAEELASRIHSALPFGQVKRSRRARSRMLLDAGFSGYTHAKSPIGLVSHYGIGSSLTFIARQGLSLQAAGQFSVSGRDYHEHLRSDIMSFQFRLAGGFQLRRRRLSASVYLGLQVDRMSEVEITTSAACKYFHETDSVPRSLCDFDLDFDRTKPVWAVGPSLALEGRVDLFERVNLFFRLQGAGYVFTTTEPDFSWPVGATAGLGYGLD